MKIGAIAVRLPLSTLVWLSACEPGTFFGDKKERDAAVEMPPAPVEGLRPPTTQGRGLDEPVPPPRAPEELPAELCNGEDDDGNGLIDDADIEDDGVCDCLRIATLGVGGVASENVVFENWPNHRAQNPVTPLGNRRLTDALLEPYQVIVILDVATMEEPANGYLLPAHHAFSADEVAAFERWVRAGGSVLTTTGYRADEAREVVNVNRLLAPFGMAYSTSKLALDGYVQDWSAHPVTSGVSNIYISNGVEPDGSRATTLARGSDERVALQAAADPAIRVLVWGDEWITYDELWQAKEEQQVELFWLNMIDWLHPQGC